jgi:ACS family sodium-dependent inorganic phosphate cotransporter-like MFS transporter 9
MTNIEAAEPLIHDKSKEIFLNFPKNNDHNQWTRKEKYVWFFTLLFGTTALYACRTTMPLVSPACAKSLNWSKTDVGTVLSSFFWGYTLTQIPGGYLSDR